MRPLFSGQSFLNSDGKVTTITRVSWLGHEITFVECMIRDVDALNTDPVEVVRYTKMGYWAAREMGRQSLQPDQGIMR